MAERCPMFLLPHTLQTDRARSGAAPPAKDVLWPRRSTGILNRRTAGPVHTPPEYSPRRRRSRRAAARTSVRPFLGQRTHTFRAFRRSRGVTVFGASLQNASAAADEVSRRAALSPVYLGGPGVQRMRGDIPGAVRPPTPSRRFHRSDTID